MRKNIFYCKKEELFRAIESGILLKENVISEMISLSLSLSLSLSFFIAYVKC